MSNVALLCKTCSYTRIKECRVHSLNASMYGDPGYLYCCYPCSLLLVQALSRFSTVTNTKQYLTGWLDRTMFWDFS